MEHKTYPLWRYKPITVDNLEAIQEELIPVLYKEYPEFDTGKPTFCFVLREKIEPYAPLYTKFIESLGILDRWHYSALITITADYNFPVHIDGVDWKTRCYGLNIPLINCEDTFTVFYDAEIDDNIVFEKSNPINSSRVTKKDTIATEIDRMPASQPAWVNNRIPHKPLSLHNKPRAIISARFRPELHDILYK